MRISTFRIEGDGSTRRMCVVSGQAFYQSSGTSSDLASVWLPFKGVCDDSFAEYAPMIQKPSVTNNRRAKIDHYFPPEVAKEIKAYFPNPKNWGRFQNMSCLIISCMLSPQGSIPDSIKEAVINYIAPNRLPITKFRDSKLAPIELNNENYDMINSKLLAMGAVATPESETVDPDLPHVFSLEEIKYDPATFNANHFIQSLHSDSLTQQFKDKLNQHKSGLESTSIDSDVTDRPDEDTDDEDEDESLSV